MKKLLEFLIAKITGKAEGTDFTVDELTDGDKATLTVTANPDIVGLIIGKEGKTIKNIRKIVAVRAVLESKSVNISVTSKE